MIENYTLFFTATIINWNKLLNPDKYKTIITDSLKFLVENKRIRVYAFVIMPNHIHLLWKILEPNLLKDVQRDFLKYTSQMIKTDLEKNHKNVLQMFKSERKDRKYQFWQDNSFNKLMYNQKVIEQKIDYIHNNPITDKWKLADVSENYKYSSASFYSNNDNTWNFLTHISEDF
jgi:REP element-mobilizing transposase RayT